MRRRRAWLVLGTALLGLVILLILVLPLGVRWLAERRVEELTGREVSIGDVDLNVFTRRLVATDVRVHGREGEAPPLTLGRLSARFSWLPLLGGRVHLERLALSGMDVWLERTQPDRFNVADVVRHILARPRGEPAQAAVDVLEVSGGRVRLRDAAVEPARTWVLDDLALHAEEVATVADAAAGRASATFRLAGAPGALEIAGLGLRPAEGRATLKIEGLELRGLSAYGRGPVGLAGGRLTAALDVVYAGDGAVTASGEATLRELRLARVGQAPPLLAAPAVAVTLHDVRYAGGDVVSGRADLAADRLTFLDATAPRARPLDVTALRATWQAPPDAAPPAAGRLTLTADLPEGGRLAARGTADPLPAAARLDVELDRVDVGLARVWLPADAGLEPVAGRLGGELRLHYAGAGLRADGRLQVAGLRVARPGQDVAVVQDERVLVTLRDVGVADGRLVLGRVEIGGSPTITDARVSPAHRVHLPRVRLAAEGGALPGGPPVRLRADASLPGGGRLQAEGTGTLGPAALSLALQASDVDMTLAAPYVPARAPVALAQGRLAAQLALRWDGALRGAGTAVARDFTLRRRGQAEPFLHHPALEAAVTGLVLRDGQLTLARVALAGAPTLVDATASPPQQFALRQLALVARDVTWPGRRPARVESALAVADGGRGHLAGTLHPGTLATDVRARLVNVDVTPADAYLPPRVPLAIEQGRGAIRVRLRHRRGDGVRLDAEGAVSDVALRITAGQPLEVRDPRIGFTVRDLRIQDGVTRLEAALVEGTPTVTRAGERAPSVGQLRAALRALRWPGGPPAPWQLAAETAGGGRISAAGTLAPATRVVAGTLEAEDAAVASLAALLPLQAPAGGRLDARLRGEVGPDGTAAVQGDLTLREGRIGARGSAPLRVGRLQVEGLDLAARHAVASRVVIEEPQVVLERHEDGSFPLRAMLTAADDTPSASPGAEPPVAAPAPGGARGPARIGEGWVIALPELLVRDGSVRFIDRGTTPFYSEEVSRLTASLRGLDTRDGAPARVTLQGIVGVDAALDLAGEIAPFASPFLLDVEGELRDFALPRTNPLLARFLDWIARRGELTTRVHYRIVGDELTARNEVIVQRLDVERAGAEERSEQLVGLPLGLVVALLKDTRGEIRIDVPIAGELRSPQFSFGDAVRSALRNLVGNLVTAPMRAIGSVFRRDGAVEDVAIDPVTFRPGSAVLRPDAAAHLQRVADFLRARPFVRLTLQPVVTEADLAALRAREVVARIQRLRREEGLASFAEAARRLWTASRPGEPAPEDDRIAAALAEQEPPPTAEDARRLAGQRAAVTRTHLVETAGIQADRVLDAPGEAPVTATAEGRVEFDLRPAS